MGGFTTHPRVTCEDWVKSGVKKPARRAGAIKKKTPVESRCALFVEGPACAARLKNHRGRCPLHGTLVIALGRGTCVYRAERIMPRARSLSRQEAGAAGDGPARAFPRRSFARNRENVPLARTTTEARGGGRKG